MDIVDGILWGVCVLIGLFVVLVIGGLWRRGR